jgi:hypothetical protein
MAIQVSGTTVIDDSRNLVNVIGIKTVNSTSLLGSGDIEAGASTVYQAIGTYIWAAYLPSFSDAGAGTDMAGVLANGTYAGSTLAPSSMGCQGLQTATTGYIDTYNRFEWGASARRFGNPERLTSGTWRLMGNNCADSATVYATIALYVRIS